MSQGNKILKNAIVPAVSDSTKFTRPNSPHRLYSMIQYSCIYPFLTFSLAQNRLFMFKDQLTTKFLQLSIPQKASLLCAMCCFSVALCVVAASHITDKQLIQISGQLYGESLTRQLARDASKPLVQGDKLSLQSLLNKLVESPIVTRGSIYDLENNLIADAGNIRRKAQSISASITFQDSIAGYAVMTLDATLLLQHVNRASWQLISLVFVLSGLSFLLCLIPARYLSTALKDLTAIAGIPPNQRNINSHIGYRGEDEVQQLADQILSAVPAAQDSDQHDFAETVLVIELKNLSERRQRLNHQEIELLMSTTNQQLTMISKLYDGRLSVHRSNGFCITFSRENGDGDFPFRTVCSGLLALQWLRLSLLDVCGGIAFTSRSLPTNPTEQLFFRQALIERAIANAGAADNQLVAEDNLYQHASVKGRVAKKQLLEDGSPQPARLIIDQVNAPYSELLARQFDTLRRQFSVQ